MFSALKVTVGTKVLKVVKLMCPLQHLLSFILQSFTLHNIFYSLSF